MKYALPEDSHCILLCIEYIFTKQNDNLVNDDNDSGLYCEVGLCTTNILSCVLSCVAAECGRHMRKHCIFYLHHDKIGLGLETKLWSE